MNTYRNSRSFFRGNLFASVKFNELKNVLEFIEVLMNRRLISIILLFISYIFVSCSEESNPLDSDKQYDWEGNYPLVNTACNDSVLFSSDRFIGTSFAPSVYIMHKSGSGMHAISDQLFTFGGSWSPRRWKILFIADSGYGSPSRGLYVMNSDGTNRKRLTPVGEDVFGSAAWSPDGSKIAYIEIDTSDQFGRGRVKLINPDGTEPKVLTDWYGGLRDVTWSPDSRRIIFDGFEYMSFDKLHIIKFRWNWPFSTIRISSRMLFTFLVTRWSVSSFL